jgi:hypothetical protein
MKQNFTVILLLTVCLAVKAATIWDGPTLTFTKNDGTDGSNPADQDRLTANVWITRGTSQGLLNVAEENFFTRGMSPTNTEWADGLLADYATLSYTDWTTWAGSHGGPPLTVGAAAVVHLISDDVYFSVTFTSWGQHPGSGGFSYVRSTPSTKPPPPPELTITNFATASGVVSFSYAANLGQSYVVQKSSDLVNWTSLVTNVALASPASFSENVSGSIGLYRVMQSAP